MTTEERKAVEEAAKQHTKKPNINYFAKGRLCPNWQSNGFCYYDCKPINCDSCNHRPINNSSIGKLETAFIAGAQFLSDLRNPSEPAIMEIMTDHNEIKAEMDRMLGFGEPSEPERGITITMKPSEELVKNIVGILINNSVGTNAKTGYTRIYQSSYLYVAQEIAALMQNCVNHEESRNITQPDVNAELLSAAKDALSTFYSIGCTDEAEIVKALIEAISNYEKQQ